MRARILMAVLVLGGAVGLARADDKPLERAELDKRVVATVYESAVRGTDIFNKGLHGECARLYEGTLLAVVPLLDHRPKLQEKAKARLARAAQLSKPDAAFELRTALDEIQNEIAPPKEIKKDPKEMKTTLWERLGGEKGVKAFVQTARVAGAEKVAFLRDKKVDGAKFDQALVEWISANSDGPPTIKYSAADLQAALGGAAITDADFDALTAVMVGQLKAAKVADADLIALAKAWEGARKDFVVKPKM